MTRNHFTQLVLFALNCGVVYAIARARKAKREGSPLKALR